MVKTDVTTGGWEIMGVVLGLEYIFLSPKMEGLPLAEPFDPLLLFVLMVGKQSSVVGSVGGSDVSVF